MLGGLGLQRRILSGAIPRVAADHPPTETGHAQPGDQERHAHPEPGGNPFTGEKDHGSTLSPTDDLRPLGAGRVLPVKAVDQPHRHPDPDCHRGRARQRIPARILALPRPIRGPAGGRPARRGFRTDRARLPRNQQRQRSAARRRARAGHRRKPRLEHRLCGRRAHPAQDPAHRRPHLYGFCSGRRPFRVRRAPDVLVPRPQLLARAKPRDRAADPEVGRAARAGFDSAAPAAISRKRGAGPGRCAVSPGLRRPRADAARRPTGAFVH